MRYISTFSGIEAASVAWAPLGWEPVAFSEIDPFPSAVLAHRFPDVPNLGDITKVDWRPYRGKADLVVGGSPCFPSGSLVLTDRGYRPIESIGVGDMVVTHKGRLRRVLATGSKVADTVILKGQGTAGIECTPNHPFLSIEKHKTWACDKHEYVYVPDFERSWVRADEMAGRFWLNVCMVDGGDIPPLDECSRGLRGGGYIDGFEFTPEFFYMVGRWLGDGWANIHQRKGRKNSKMKRVYICCAFDKADYLEERLSRCGIHFGRTTCRTTYRFTASSTQLYDWLVGNFGVHAGGKNIPAWALSMRPSFRRALFDGYMDSDGCYSGGKWSSSSISRALTLGMKALAGTLGLTSSVVLNENHRDAVIEGRHINEHPSYHQNYYEASRSAVFDHGMPCGNWWGMVRKVLPGRSGVTVYNLEVEEDHSYTVDGIAVHNCQSFSTAGKREGLKGESGLMFEFIRCVREVRPRWFLWENVPGALSSESGKAFGTLLHEMAHRGGYGLAWRVLDAQFFGVAQRRRRVFLVGRAGDGYDEACRVLFEPDFVPGNSASSKAKRKELAERAGRGARAAGFGDPAATSGSIGYQPEQAQTLKAGSNKAATGCVISLQSDGTRSNGVQHGSGWNADGSSYTLNATDRQGVLCMASGQAHAEIGEDVGTTLSSRQYKDPPIVNAEYVVRRLTPVECERLQGFPDGWTRVPYRGKPADECPDGPRYKAIGNSMCVNVMRWIGRRIQEVDASD